MDTDYPRYISAAWVFNPTGAGAFRPDRIGRKLHEKVQKVLNKEGLHNPVIAPESGAFWCQGRRVAEAISWVCRQGVGQIRPILTCIQSSWSWEQKGGQIIPEGTGDKRPWPVVQDPVSDYPDILGGPASAVALSVWTNELEALESSPPWVYWALRADQKMLRAELEKCAWSDKDIGHWWQLMEGLLADTGRHWEVRVVDKRVSIHRLPISSHKACDEVIQILGTFLPPSARRPARLSGLAPSPEKGGNPLSSHHEPVSSVLRGWVSASRFWSLRRALHWNDLREHSNAVRIWDFEKLPRAVAHRTLDQFTKLTRLGPPPAGTRLPLLDQVYEIAPAWSGWPDLLEVLQGLDALEPGMRAVLTHMKEEAMDRSISQPDGAPMLRPARF